MLDFAKEDVFCERRLILIRQMYDWDEGEDIKGEAKDKIIEIAK
jgi:hypothetical protein